jgi:hypothetical protein
MSEHQVLANRLIDLGRRIEAKTVEDLRHPQQTDMPEWQGADVIITSDFTGHVSGFLGHDLMVRSRHAQPLTWLFFELRDAFGDELDAGNKYGFYGSLAEAALTHLAQHQPEDADYRSLLKAVLTQAFTFHAELRQHDSISGNGSIILHSTDQEGRQQRLDLNDLDLDK